MRKTANFMIAVAGLCCVTPASAKDKAPPPQPSAEPDWGQVRKESEAAILSSLIDPSSAQLTWTQGFKWSYYKPILQGKQWGWVGCGTVNAKNRMGGYVGATAFVIVYDNGVKYNALDDPDWPLIGSGCKNGGFPPLQSAFLDAPTTSSGGGSVADELTKLSALRDKGVITQEEFDAEKQKLLAR